MKSRARIPTIVASLAACAGVGAYLGANAVAGGIPAADTLVYSGFIEEGSMPLEDPERPIAVEVWSEQQAGTKLCERGSEPTPVIRGRFRVAMPAACVDAVRANPDAFVDVKVDGRSLGRSRVSATPYAVESDHAVRADRSGSTETITNWVPFNMTFGSSVAPDPVPVGLDEHGAWRRVGDSMEITYRMRSTGSMGQTGGVLLLAIPAGFRIDTTKFRADQGFRSAIVGHGAANVAAAGRTQPTADYPQVVYVWDETHLFLRQVDVSDTLTDIGRSYSDPFGTPSLPQYTLGFRATVPIVGWSAGP